MTEKFAVNDYVIYGKNGLCQISELKTVHMANTKNEYYVLNSVNGNQVTIYVPCCNEVLMKKMRYPMTKDEIDCMLSSVKGQKIKWIDNNNERNEYFHSIAESENYKDWLLLIGCIYLKNQEKLAAGKHLSSHDENTLKLLEKLIEDEFCYSLQLDKNQVSNYIKEKLEI